MDTLTTVHATLLLGSPWMLVFLAALAVPWLIARATRAPLRQVSLGTTSFVLRAARQHRFWKRLPWVLAVLRSLVIAAVVLGAAEPIWLSRSAESEAPGFGVVVLDVDAVSGRSAPVVAAIEATGRANAAQQSPRWRVTKLSASYGSSGVMPEDTRLIILTDGAVPSPAIRSQLAEWIDGGGQVWVLLGPRSIASQNGWVASWLAENVDIDVDGTRSGLPERIRSRLPAGHPITTLAGPSVETHAVLKPSGSAAINLKEPADDSSLVVMETAETRSPLLVVRALGRGQVVVSALPWSLAPLNDGRRELAWSDLAAWPAFPVVIEELLTTCQTAARGSGLPARRGHALSWLTGTRLTGGLLTGAMLLLACEALFFKGSRSRRTPQ